jgi:hypothetical protein
MAESREQIAERARQTAAALLVTFEREGVVAQFVDDYVATYKRRGIKDSPLRHRELLSTLSREALLAAAVKVNSLLPKLLTGRESPLLRGADAEAADVFREEFFSTLATELRWTPSDLEEFRSDQELLAQMTAALPRSMKSRRGAAPQGPFADRCALLLDPSMLEKARQAAAKFQIELEALTERVLSAVFKLTRRKR